MSAGKVLRYTLIVRHPETDHPTALLAGEEVPDWASDLVHADDYEDGKAKASAGAEKSEQTPADPPPASEQKPAPAKKAPAKKAAAKKTAASKTEK